MNFLLVYFLARFAEQDVNITFTLSTVDRIHVHEMNPEK